MLPLVKIQLMVILEPRRIPEIKLEQQFNLEIAIWKSADSFTIKLASQPTNQVIFDVAVSDDTEASVNSSTLTFNTSTGIKLRQSLCLGKMIRFVMALSTVK